MPEKNKDYFDTKYVVQLQKGDQTAFDKIYEFYKNHIYWMGISYFSNEEKAKDLVQSVFLEIYQTIHKLKDPVKFYAWMNRIAYSRCLLMVRYEMKDSLHYTKNMGEEFTESSIQDNKSEDALTKLQKEQIKDIIVSEIEKLPPDVRTICYLRFFEDLTYAEISEITNVPSGTTASYISRLKPKLKKALIRQGFTSAGCLSLVVLPNIVEYFKVFIDTKASFSTVASSDVLQEVKQSNNKQVKQTKKTWQTAAYGCIGIALTLPIVGLIARENAILPSVNKGDNATIQKLTYPKQLTNSPFKIQVEVSNKNYDEVLLNNKTDLSVNWNGNYKVSLMRDGKEIDSKAIRIHNIDRDIPLITGQLFKDGIMTLYIMDEDSAVDFEHIEFYENGVVTNQIKINKTKKEIYVPKGVADDNLLKIPDIAGNVLEARIIFYEIIANN